MMGESLKSVTDESHGKKKNIKSLLKEFYWRLI